MSLREEFVKAIELHQPAFGFEPSANVITMLANHFDLVMQHNPLLHLTAPASAEEFAIRHMLESLTMLEFLPEGARFADVGSGAGFPAIPCLIARGDLRGVLIESKEKKAAFLESVVTRCDIDGRAEIVNKQFSETPLPNVSHVSCRALDKFTQHLPKLIKWGGDRRMLFFGGPALRDEMARLGLKFEEKLMPMSEQRYLFVSR